MELVSFCPQNCLFRPSISPNASIDERNRINYGKLLLGLDSLFLCLSRGFISLLPLFFPPHAFSWQKIQVKTLKGDLFAIEVDAEDQVMDNCPSTCQFPPSFQRILFVLP